MSAIDDLVAQVEDKALRDRLKIEVDRITTNKKFGLVFEEHLPELTPIYGAKIRKYNTVCRRDGSLTETYLVLSVKNGQAHCINKKTGEKLNISTKNLIVERQFGEPIFPSLVPIDRVQNGPDTRLWHTLIEADNFHALQLLEYIYSDQVDCIYIDPPYNTRAKDWKYNNNYVDPSDQWRHSKWLAMMQRRLKIAKNLLKRDGVLICTIDDNENAHVCMLINQIFPDRKIFPVTIQHNPGGTQGDQFSVTHEYALFVLSPESTIFNKPHLAGETYSLRRWGSTSNRFEGKTCFYPIYVKRGEIIKIGNVPQDDFHPEKQTVFIDDGIREVWPIDKNNIEKKWRYARDTIESVLDRAFVIESSDRTEIKLRRENEQQKTVWTDKKYNAEANGTDLLKKIIVHDFPYPKSLYAVADCLYAAVGKKDNALVLDFFAGSGTTLHAVNLLNSQDSGRRRCILVTNNEVSDKQAQILLKDEYFPGDEQWERYGICQLITWPKTKYSIIGKHENGNDLNGEYLTGNTTLKEMNRVYKQISITNTKNLNTVSKKKQLVSLIGKDKLPQSAVNSNTSYIVLNNYPASILFDESKTDEWLEALAEQDHIKEFYIVTTKPSIFNEIKSRIAELLGKITFAEEKKRPMREGFLTNVEYFRLEFLEKDDVALGKQLKEILPILWLKSGAVGLRPELTNNNRYMLLPKYNNFAILIDETHFTEFKMKLETRNNITHIFLVTDSEDSFLEMAEQLTVENVVQLYRDYLGNFMINIGD